MDKYTRCLHCSEVLKWQPGVGWLHEDGQLYKTKHVECRHCAGTGEGTKMINPNADPEYVRYEACPFCKGMGSVLVDDHCAMPVESSNA